MAAPVMRQRVFSTSRSSGSSADAIRAARGLMRLGPATSSFPSGHAASDLSFTFGVAQELPLMFVPLSAATLGAHWALVRGREHYPSDVFACGALGIAVALAAWIARPPRRDPIHGEATPVT